MKSRYIANFDLKKCKNCKDLYCLEKCVFGGIKIKDGKLQINSENCWGCGLCASVRINDAVKMREVRREDYIPKNQAIFFDFDRID